MPISPERKEARRRHLVRAAHDLIRETGDAGFSMTELADRAGVSPATPYNLLGTKGKLLELIVRDEFESFNRVLADKLTGKALDRLFAGIDLIADHYAAEADFYRGLYRAQGRTEANELRLLMLEEGQHLWGGMIAQAMAEGEIARTIEASSLTELLLRLMAGVIYPWLVEDWTQEQFHTRIYVATRLLLLGLLGPDRSQEVRNALHERQRQVEATG